MATEVEGDGAGGRAEPAGNRRPDPRRTREAVDEQDAGGGMIGRRLAPIEEVDPVIGLDKDDEPGGLGRGIRRRRGGRIEPELAGS